MKLFRYQNFIKESESDSIQSEINEIAPIILEVVDKFDLYEAADHNRIGLDEYVLTKTSLLKTFIKSDIVFVVNLNRDMYPDRKVLKRIDEVRDYILDNIVPVLEDNMGYGVKIKILEYKVDAWNFVPSGIRMDILILD
jgi:hypothetical protein